MLERGLSIYQESINNLIEYIPPEGTHPTLSAQEKSGRYFIYHNGIVRKLTLNECYRFMGFPENFVKVGSDANLYERIGNSVCVL